MPRRLKLELLVLRKKFEFLKCTLDVFNTFIAKGFSETSPVMHLNKQIFGVNNFRNT